MKSPRLDNNSRCLEYDCPVCKTPTKSRGYTTTCLAYYSPKGHNHDDNCRKFDFKCPKGHMFRVRVQNACPDCEWVGKADCSICGANVREIAALYEYKPRSEEKQKAALDYETLG
jgi:hypothetical protein